ncbi:hypothetical protein J3R83DRAFT_1311 [Lanmaoa asiatica]|nr:hypothetical protein J3R83DRAFT_1311 [Lanmaoa asiatica]
MTNAALQAGISACGPGRPFNSIGRAIHELVRNTPYSVCNSFSGHGIGRFFHQPPWIYHTRTPLGLALRFPISELFDSERRTGDDVARALLYHRGMDLRSTQLPY